MNIPWLNTYPHRNFQSSVSFIKILPTQALFKPINPVKVAECDNGVRARRIKKKRERIVPETIGQSYFVDTSQYRGTIVVGVGRELWRLKKIIIISYQSYQYEIDAGWGWSEVLMNLQTRNLRVPWTQMHARSLMQHVTNRGNGAVSHRENTDIMWSRCCSFYTSIVTSLVMLAKYKGHLCEIK